jgi:predicted ATPase
MKISKIELNDFKRFKRLSIDNLSEQAKLIVLVGPNGCGKTSLFDAMNAWYRLKNSIGFANRDTDYYCKPNAVDNNWYSKIIIQCHNPSGQPAMYFRTAYRNSPDFNMKTINNPQPPQKEIRFQRLIDNDSAVEQNFQRLIYNTLSGVYSEHNDDKTVKQLRHELIGKVRESMQRVFEDLLLCDIGDPLSGGSFFFEKGESKSYHYKNLSGGEKAAFDLLLDIIVKAEYYQDAVFVIDEPEIHMHTSLQSRLLKELYNVIPDNSQLWISSHSLGVMKAARELAHNNPDMVQVLDFHGHNFDQECIITPSRIDKVLWEKFLSMALEDLADFIAPKVIYICEGTFAGTKRNNFDAEIYNKIFGSKYPHVTFISGGACADLKKDHHVGHAMLACLFSSTKIYRILDRDDLCPEEVEEFKSKDFYVLERRHLEAYLFDNDVLIKLAISKGKTEDESIIKVKEIMCSAIANSVSRGNAEDDVKSASGQIYNEFKTYLSLTNAGSNTDAFMKSTLAPLVTEDMSLYQELERDVFGARSTK